MGDERVREIRERLDAAARYVSVPAAGASMAEYIAYDHAMRERREGREALAAHAPSDVEYLLAEVERLRVAVRAEEGWNRARAVWHAMPSDAINKWREGAIAAHEHSADRLARVLAAGAGETDR